MQAAELKSLQTTRKELENNIEELQKQLSEIDSQFKQIDRQKASILRNLDSVKKVLRETNARINTGPQKAGEIVVSEHAIVRYVERVLNIKPQEIADKILSPEKRKEWASFGSGTLNVDGTHRVKIIRGVVVTVLRMESDDRD